MTEKEKKIALLVSEKLTFCAQKNLRKIMITLFAMNLLGGIFVFICSTLFEKRNEYSPILSLVAAIAFLFILMILFYGLNAMLLKMERNEFVTFGFLFLGFKRFRAIAKYALVFALLIFLSCAVFVALIITGDYAFFNLLGSISLFESAEFFAVILFSLIALSILPWSFVYSILAIEPEKQHSVFRRSKNLFRGRVKLFFKIFFKNIKPYLLKLFACWLITTILSTTHFASQSNLFAMFESVFSWGYLYQFYVTQSILFLLIPIIYDAFLKDSVENQLDFVDIKYLTDGKES